MWIFVENCWRCDHFQQGADIDISCEHHVALNVFSMLLVSAIALPPRNTSIRPPPSKRSQRCGLWAENCWRCDYFEQGPVIDISCEYDVALLVFLMLLVSSVALPSRNTSIRPPRSKRSQRRGFWAKTAGDSMYKVPPSGPPVRLMIPTEIMKRVAAGGYTLLWPSSGATCVEPLCPCERQDSIATARFSLYKVPRSGPPVRAMIPTE